MTCDNANGAINHARTVMHPGVKLRHIRGFLDIAAAGSLSTAARAQGITQPALSRTLAELEVLLGSLLFLRQGRRLVLTEAGTLFRRHAVTGLQALDAGAAALSGGAEGARITLGVLPTAASRLVPRVMLRHRAVRPQTVLTVVTGPHAYLMGLLRAGGVDLVIGRMPAPSEMAGLAFEHLYEEPVVLAARAGHPLAARPAAEVLARAPVILPPAQAIIRRAVDDYLASLGLASLVPAFETVALAIGRGLLLSSDAVWFISQGVIADDLDAGTLKVIPTSASFLSGSVGLTRWQISSSPALTLLTEIAREEAS